MADYPNHPYSGMILDDLSWLIGRWTGMNGADLVEEVWSEPAGGAMLGMFRWIRDGASWFYEIITIAQEENTLVMRLKHFSPDLKGWEEKDAVTQFVLVAAGPQEAVFLQQAVENPPWLVYRRAAESLVCYFVRAGSLPPVEEWFVYTLQEL